MVHLRAAESLRGDIARRLNRDNLASLAVHPWSAPIALAVVMGVAVGVAYANTEGAFNSPDDVSNFATARAIVEDGRPWLSLPADVPDPYDMLHPRAFTTVDSKAVPIQPLTTATVHGAGWRITGSYAVSAGLLAAVAILGWTRFGQLVARTQPLVALTALLVAMPMFYWLTRQYFTVSTYLVFLGWSLAFAVLAARKRSLPLALLAGGLQGLALSCRPDFVFAHGFAVLAVAAWALFAGVKAREFAWLAGAWVAATALVGAAVVLGTNAWLFGSPFTFGYDLARENPGFDQPLELDSPIPALNSLAARLFPFGAPDLAVAARMAWRYLVVLTPALAVVAIAGLVVGRNARGFAVLAAGLGVMALYVVLSRSSLNLQGSVADDPLPSHSLVRYFLPIYIAMFVAALFALKALLSWTSTRAQVGAAVFCFAGVLLSAWQVLFAFEGVSLVPWSENLDERDAVVGSLIRRYTEPEAAIVSATYDKFAVASSRYAVTWPAIGEDFGFEPGPVSETIGTLMEAGVPVYVWDTTEVGRPLMEELCSRSLWLELLDSRLYRVIQDEDCRPRFDALYPD